MVKAARAGASQTTQEVFHMSRNSYDMDNNQNNSRNSQDRSQDRSQNNSKNSQDCRDRY